MSTPIAIYLEKEQKGDRREIDFSKYAENIKKGYVPTWIGEYGTVEMMHYPLFIAMLSNIDKLINKVNKLEDDINVIKKLIIDEHDRNQAIRGFNALSKELNDEKNNKSN